MQLMVKYELDYFPLNARLVIDRYRRLEFLAAQRCCAL